jgi:hypothetical protein
MEYLRRPTFRKLQLVPVTGLPVAALFGTHALKALLVTFGLIFLVALAAFLVYILALPSDRGGVK